MIIVGVDGSAAERGGPDGDLGPRGTGPSALTPAGGR